MPGLLFDKRASVWRMMPVPGGGTGMTEQQKFSSIQCAIIPISTFDQQQPYSLESTHVIFVPHWLVLQKSDQVRYGRRDQDEAGDVLPWIYVLNGRKSTSQGIPHIAWYATERD